MYMNVNMNRLGLCTCVHYKEGSYSLPHSTVSLSYSTPLIQLQGRNEHPHFSLLWHWSHRQHTSGKNVSCLRSKTSPANEAGQPTTPWYVCALYMQANFTAKHHCTVCHAVSTHIILQMESTVTSHKTQSSLLCHSVCSYVDDHIHLIPQNSYTHL